MSCNSIKGGQSAWQYGTKINGALSDQMAKIPMRGGKWPWFRFGYGGKKNVKTPKKMTAGTTLLDASVPALLLMSQQTYKRKGSQSRGRRNNRSRRTHKRR